MALKFDYIQDTNLEYLKRVAVKAWLDNHPKAQISHTNSLTYQTHEGLEEKTYFVVFIWYSEETRGRKKKSQPLLKSPQRGKRISGRSSKGKGKGKTKASLKSDGVAREAEAV